MATHHPGPGLCFGDVILLEFLRSKPAPERDHYDEWGFLSADITPSGHVGMATGTVDKPPREIGECLWTVEPVHQHCAFRELRAHMTAVKALENFKGFQSEERSRSLAVDQKRMENALVREIRFNAKLALRRKGDPIAFGQPVLMLLFVVAE